MVGELAMGRFRVLERIGSGGMGTVYRAFDERLERPVALKVIERADAERVTREAQAVARLNHPAIVTLYELGCEADRALLVSELVEGESLIALARRGALSDREVAAVGVDVCDALAHAHARGVIHRDVKPENVIVPGDRGARRAKLMDFGIATIAGAPGLTATGEVIGTLAYMSPEQADGDAVGEATDTYSLALSLYECWTGSNPVARSSPAETSRAIGGFLPPLQSSRPNFPRELGECIDACLDPDPELRPPIEALRATLRACAPRLSIRPVPASEPEREAGSLPSAGNRGLQRLAVIGLVLTVAVLAGPAGRPGVALAIAALVLPGLVVSSRLRHAAVPLTSPLLGALSLGAAYPALAGACGRLRERACLGALGWWFSVACSAAVGIGPRLHLVHRPPAGWEQSAGTTLRDLLVPLLSPESLAGALAFAAAAASFGVVLRLRHAAVALLGALVWSAALAAVMGLVGHGRIVGAPVVAPIAALVAIALRFGWTRTIPRRTPAPVREAAAA